MKGHRFRMCLWPVLVIVARQRVRKYAALRAVCYPNLFGAGGWLNGTSGMFFQDTVLLHPFAHFTAVSMAVAWVTFSALGRQLSRNWTLPVRGLAVLGYWVLIGATITNPWINFWVTQFYGDMLAFPTTGLLMGGSFYPAEIYHVILGISLGLLLASVGIMAALVQRHRAVRQHALKE